jgi:hypothetical protein
LERPPAEIKSQRTREGMRASRSVIAQGRLGQFGRLFVCAKKIGHNPGSMT